MIVNLCHQLGVALRLVSGKSAGRRLSPLQQDRALPRPAFTMVRVRFLSPFDCWSAQRRRLLDRSRLRLGIWDYGHTTGVAGLLEGASKATICSPLAIGTDVSWKFAGTYMEKYLLVT